MIRDRFPWSSLKVVDEEGRKVRDAGIGAASASTDWPRAMPTTARKQWEGTSGNEGGRGLDARETGGRPYRSIRDRPADVRNGATTFATRTRSDRTKRPRGWNRSCLAMDCASDLSLNQMNLIIHSSLSSNKISFIENVLRHTSRRLAAIPSMTSVE